MIKTKFVFAVSFVAMMAVGAAHAEIAGVSYVEEQVGVATTAANNAQTSANNANTAAGKAQTSADNAQDAADAAQESADAAAASAKTANDAVALKQDKLTAGQLNAANSGITAAKVSTYDGYATTIAGKQDKKLATEITTAVSSAKDSYYPSVGLMETSIATANNDVMDSVNAKQDALSTTQLNAVNSGVTSSTVSQVATNKTNIATNTSDIAALETAVDGKQATLTTSNIKGAGSVSVGISNGVITVTGTDNNTTYSTGTASTSGLTKLYTGTGTNTDGTMTQAALKTALDGKLSTSGTAAKATADASGNTITSTYATKSELTSGLAGKQDKMLATEITTTVSSAKDSYYPSVGLMETSIATANNDVMDSVNAKLASVSSTGTGSVVKAVAKDGTAVKATLGYIGSSDITDGGVALADMASNSVNSAKIVDASIATADIADGAVTTAKLASNAVTSAKISDGAVATADIAAGAVTAAKTTGIYGFIPSGGEGSSATAAIWVE